MPCPLVQVLDHIVGRARTFGVLPQWLPTSANRRFRAAMRTLDAAIFATIRARRPIPPAPFPRSEGEGVPPAPHQEGEGGGDAITGELGDLLSMLMSAQDADTGQAMTDQQLRNEMMTLLLAGHETVASALAWTWHLLATHPEAEAKLHDELTAVLAGRTPTADDLPNLSYTRAVFEEALRLYPPAWIITRRALADDEIDGYRIPAGAMVVASPYATHRHPAFWPAPEAFWPERFSKEGAAGRPRFAWYPFGGGPRQCIGDQFAMTEAQLIIATVAQRYCLSPVPGHPVEVEPGVTYDRSMG